MAIVQQNFAAYLRSLFILFIALAMGQIMVLVALYVVRAQGTQTIEAPWVTQVLPLVLVGMAVLSSFLYRRNIANARAKADLKGKLTAYRVALLLRWALLEGMVLLIGVMYFLTGIVPLLYVAVILILVFIFIERPHRDKLVQALELTTDEQYLLDDPNTIVSEISQRPG